MGIIKVIAIEEMQPRWFDWDYEDHCWHCGSNGIEQPVGRKYQCDPCFVCNGWKCVKCHKCLCGRNIFRRALKPKQVKDIIFDCSLCGYQHEGAALIINGKVSEIYYPREAGRDTWERDWQKKLLLGERTVKLEKCHNSECIEKYWD